MITQAPTIEMIADWKATWLKYRDKLQANRKSGNEVLMYLQEHYSLVEIHEKYFINCVVHNVMENEVNAEKLAEGKFPNPRVFTVENKGEGTKFYLAENLDVQQLDQKVEKIIVGIDLESGYVMVEGSSLLWDELNAFRGLDELDLQNYVCVAQYVESCKRCGNPVIK